MITRLLRIIQSVWGLPTLDARAELQFQGQTVPPSDLHFYYVGNGDCKSILLYHFRNYITQQIIKL